MRAPCIRFRLDARFPAHAGGVVIRILTPPPYLTLATTERERGRSIGNKNLSCFSVHTCLKVFLIQNLSCSLLLCLSPYCLPPLISVFAQGSGFVLRRHEDLKRHSPFAALPCLQGFINSLPCFPSNYLGLKYTNQYPQLGYIEGSECVNPSC